MFLGQIKSVLLRLVNLHFHFWYFSEGLFSVSILLLVAVKFLYSCNRYVSLLFGWHFC